MNVVAFAGTTEGRKLCETLAKDIRFAVTACVATEYGEALLPEGVIKRAGRMDASAMADLLCETQAETAVDATHPYAIDAHNEIRKACETARVPLIRLKRLASDGADRAAETPCLEVPDMEAAAGFLAGTNGNILLAIGAKELDAFADKQGLTERVFARVLPMPSSIEKCASIGLPPSRIIAMQGPFSLEMNVATFRQYRIEWLATKASGDAGGEREKLEAARRCGVGAVLVRRPDEGEDGLTLEETLARLFKEAGLCASR